MKKIETVGIAVTSFSPDLIPVPRSVFPGERRAFNRRRRARHNACRVCSLDTSRDKARVKIVGQGEDIQIVGPRKRADRYFCGECWEGLMNAGK